MIGKSNLQQTKKDLITTKAVEDEIVTGSGTIKSSNKFEVTPVVTWSKLKRFILKKEIE